MCDFQDHCDFLKTGILNGPQQIILGPNKTFVRNHLLCDEIHEIHTILFPNCEFRVTNENTNKSCHVFPFSCEHPAEGTLEERSYNKKNNLKTDNKKINDKQIGGYGFC